MFEMKDFILPVNDKPIKIRKIDFKMALKLPKPSDWKKNIPIRKDKNA